MRSGPDQRPRGRFNANRPFKQQPRGPQNNQTFDSNGPDIRVRGSAHQIFERYVALAREASRSALPRMPVVPARCMVGLRLRPWWPVVATFLYLVAFALPILTLLGLVKAGRQLKLARLRVPA